MVLGEVFLDTALKKTGRELFKELYRIYPLSEVEDYFGNGLWNDTQMRAHYKLIFEHREIAGSPDPPPMSEMKFPVIPEGKSAPVLPNGATQMAIKAGGTTQMASLMAAALKFAQAQEGPKAAGVPGITPAAKANPLAAVNELKSIMAFVAKHKLDFAKTSNLIMTTPQAVRKVVMEEFAPKEGGDMVAELKTFIEEKKAAAPAEPEPAAAAAAAAVATTPAAVATPAVAPALAVGGIKRPAMAAVVPGPAAQRPRLMMPPGGAAGGARAPMVPGLITK